MTGTTVALALLATYRLALLATTDRVLVVPRAWAMDWLTRHGHTELAYVLRCPWCASVWLGVPVAAAAVWAPDAWWYQWPALALAGSAAAGYLASYATPE